MNCADSRLFLHAHADGELDVANSLELERHLQTCTACAAETKSVHSLKTAMRQSSLHYDAPDSLRKAVRQMARASGNDTRPRLFQSLLLWKWLASGATAVALAAILLRPAGISERDQLLDDAVASHVRSLMGEHLTDVASSDQHTVKPWFTGKLDFAPDVKDFAAQGFPLVGGRLDYVNGRAVAALVYRRNKHFINVFIRPAAGANGRESRSKNVRGYSVISRETGGLHYWLVSDLNEKELAELANLFGR
jgi:anti-sigma factor RsiW